MHDNLNANPGTPVQDVLDTHSSAIVERLKVALGAASDQDLADMLGKSRQAVSFARKRKVPFDWVLSAALRSGRSVDWLINLDKLKLDKADYAAQPEPSVPDRVADRVEEEPRGYGRHAAKAVSEEEVALLEEFAMIPKVKARLSGGSGSFETDGEVEAFYAFRRDWLSRKGRQSRMVLMEVTGDSMEPVIRDRDMVLIDQSQTDIYAGKIYAVGIDDLIVVKRLDPSPGRLILRSENRAYAPLEIDFSRNPNVRIIGRVVWLGRENL